MLVLGGGSWAEVGKCFWGFVWIIFQWLCRWTTANGCAIMWLFVCVYCDGGCVTAEALLFHAPLCSSFLPFFPPGWGQQIGTVFLNRPMWRWPVEAGGWKIRLQGYKRPTKQPAPGAMLCCAMLCLTFVPLLTTPLKMTNAPINCFPRLATAAWCSWSPVSALVHQFATTGTTIYYVGVIFHIHQIWFLSL